MIDDEVPTTALPFPKAEFTKEAVANWLKHDSGFAYKQAWELQEDEKNWYLVFNKDKAQALSSGSQHT